MSDRVMDWLLRWMPWLPVALCLVWVPIGYDMSEMVETGREPIRVTGVYQSDEGAVTYFRFADGRESGECGASPGASWLVRYRGRLGWEHRALK